MLRAFRRQQMKLKPYWIYELSCKLSLILVLFLQLYLVMGKAEGRQRLPNQRENEQKPKFRDYISSLVFHFNRKFLTKYQQHERKREKKVFLRPGERPQFTPTPITGCTTKQVFKILRVQPASFKLSIVTTFPFITSEQSHCQWQFYYCTWSFLSFNSMWKLREKNVPKSKW